jgi:hypothetical protein
VNKKRFKQIFAYPDSGLYEHILSNLTNFMDTKISIRTLEDTSLNSRIIGGVGRVTRTRKNSDRCRVLVRTSGGKRTLGRPRHE